MSRPRSVQSYGNLTVCGFTTAQLRKIVKNDDCGLARIALACHEGRGVRLSAKEVERLFLRDNALHRRVFVNWNEDGSPATPTEQEDRS